MTLTTEQLRAVETTKEFRALLKYMRAIAKAEPESVKEKFELEEGLWRYASQKTIKAIVGHIDALEFALAANREAQPVAELVYSSAMPRFIGDTNEVEGYRCWIHGETRLVPTMEQAYADAKAVCTAPPAPAVPPEIPLTSPVAAEYVAGWNACRAAMLAQPVSSGYKLPEGWKLVPVEPTAEMINAALASGALSIRSAYRLMLAAAPTQGNNNE
ncbi:hypothetical protein ACV1BL_16805 [Serratia marcescens]